MSRSTNMNKPPRCPVCGDKERLIGAEFGAFIFRCERCFQRDMKALREEFKALKEKKDNDTRL
jgi:predicted  nucleic acid-binding Zn ribbon protein